MSDGIKWAALLSALLIVIAMIIALPLADNINLTEAKNALDIIVNVLSKPLYTVRAIINNFLTPVGRTILSGLIYYIFFKWVFTTGFKAIVGIYKWIFK